MIRRRNYAAYLHHEKLVLTQSESGPLLRTLLSTSSVTFYNHGSSTTFDDITTFLHDRIQEIVRLNPWLSGTLIANEQGIQCAYKQDWREAIFSVVEDSTLHDQLEYSMLYSTLKKYLVKTGSACLFKENELLYKVTLIKINKDKFALVHSTSHMIADGFTHYRLYGMLSKNILPQSLIAERIFKYDRVSQDLISYSNLKLASPFIQFIYKLMTFSNRFSKINATIVQLNQDWVTKQKQLFGAHATTSSVTSQLIYKLTKSEFGGMTLNLRNRIPGLTNDHAGNYFENLALDSKSYSELSNIRNIFEQHYPAFDQGIPTNARLSFCTDWVKIYQQVDLSDCIVHSHWPLKDPQATMNDLTVLFHMGYDNDKMKKKIGLLVLSRTLNKHDLLSHPAFLDPTF